MVINFFPSGLLYLLIVLSVFNGGRTPFGLVLYQIISLLLLFRQIQSKTVPKTLLDLPLLLFLAFSFFSSLYSLTIGVTGFVYFSTLLIHSIIFYLFVSIRDENFRIKFLYLLILLCVFFSASFLTQTALNNVKILFFPNANLLASFLNCGVLAAFCNLVFGSDKNSFRYWLLSLAIGVCLLAEFLIFSRGALLALAGGLLVLTIFQWKKMLIPCLWITVFFGLLFLISPSHIKFKKLVSPDHFSRITIWKSALHAMSQKPIFGWGIGGFHQAYELNKLPMQEQIAQYEKTTRFAHNEFLQVGVELGLAGVFLLLWILGIIFRASPPPFLKGETGGFLKEKLTGLSCAVALLLHSLFDFNLHLPILAFLFIFFCSLLIPENVQERRISDKVRSALNWIVIFWIVLDTVVLAGAGMLKIGKYFENQQNPEKAVFYYRWAAMLNPFDADLLEELPEKMPLQTKQELLSRALFFHSGNSNLYAKLASIYYNQSLYDSSAYYYLEAIKHNPKSVFYYAGLGDVYIHQSHFETALTCYKLAVGLEPFYIFGYHRLGEISLALGDRPNAEKYFNAVLKIRDLGLKPNSDYSRRLLDFDTSVTERKSKELQ